MGPSFTRKRLIVSLQSPWMWLVPSPRLSLPATGSKSKPIWRRPLGRRSVSPNRLPSKIQTGVAKHREFKTFPPNTLHRCEERHPFSDLLFFVGG